MEKRTKLILVGLTESLVFLERIILASLVSLTGFFIPYLTARLKMKEKT